MSFQAVLKAKIVYNTIILYLVQKCFYCLMIES